MKKFLFRLLVLFGAGALALSLSACGGSNTAKTDLVTLKVGASPVPHAKILKHLEESGEAAKVGLKLEVKEFTDYVQPNEALKAGDIDANYFQTVPYLNSESKSRGYKFQAGKGIHLEPLAIFSNKIKKLDELKDGATITVINDPSNQGRALALLAANGLLNVKGTDASVVQIKDDPKANPRKFKFHEVDGPALASTLPDVDIAVINGNYAQSAGLKPSEALSIEKAEGNPALNILVWRADETEKLDAIKKLDALLHSDATKKFIESTWADKSVIPAF